jgi:hypothetical protein
MRRRAFTTFAWTTLVLVFLLAASSTSQAQESPKTKYPSMAPVDQYMMEPDAEIALARSAAPDSIAKDAEVMVMDRHGYKTAVKGTNGFVCVVERSWTAPIDDPNFWNPKLRGPLCLNPAAARTYLPLTIRKTALVLAGASKAEMFAGMRAAFDKKELAALEPGAMCFMLSKQGYLGDGVGHWHPHLMFFVPLTEPAAWGADLPGSPVMAGSSREDRLTIFFVPVAKWSDGTDDLGHEHQGASQ